jgi:two-component system, OmpR family, sensor histidine kinase SenX3
VTGRHKAIVFFVVLCVVLVAAAIPLGISWIVVVRSVTPVVIGAVLFGLIIAGLIVYTVFLVMEIRRNEEHDTFINAVTHELKTPIASIRLYLETLQSRPLTEAQRRRFYDIMLADAERLHRTVDQVLQAGALSRKPRTEGYAPLDVGGLARECVDLAIVRHHLPPGAITHEMLDDGPLMVQGDTDELRTLLTNLLDNAVKYSGDAVCVTVTVAAPARDRVWVRVQDHGVGIPRKYLKRIFNRFYRVQTRGFRRVKGTGLGLYIVRRIARAHGGRVFAHSEGEGRGATFTVELPRAMVEAVPLRRGA